MDPPVAAAEDDRWVWQQLLLLVPLFAQDNMASPLLVKCSK